MSNTYSIAFLAASAYLRAQGIGSMAGNYVCDEGSAEMIVVNGDETILVTFSAKRQSGEAAPPKYSAKRLQRIAMCYLSEHPEVTKLRFDVLEVLIGANATATVSAVEGAYSWER